MPVQTFWDSSFKVKSLEPQFADALAVTSPLTLVSATPQELTLPDNTKGVIFRRDPANTGNKVTVEISKATPFSAEAGTFTADLDDGEIMLPVENIVMLRITNDEGSNRSTTVVYLVSPE